MAKDKGKKGGGGSSSSSGSSRSASTSGAGAGRGSDPRSFGGASSGGGWSPSAGGNPFDSGNRGGGGGSAPSGGAGAGRGGDPRNFGGGPSGAGRGGDPRNFGGGGGDGGRNDYGNVSITGTKGDGGAQQQITNAVADSGMVEGFVQGPQGPVATTREAAAVQALAGNPAAQAGIAGLLGQPAGNARPAPQGPQQLAFRDIGKQQFAQQPVASPPGAWYDAFMAGEPAPDLGYFAEQRGTSPAEKLYGLTATRGDFDAFFPDGLIPGAIPGATPPAQIGYGFPAETPPTSVPVSIPGAAPQQPTQGYVGSNGIPLNDRGDVIGPGAYNAQTPPEVRAAMEMGMYAPETEPVPRPDRPAPASPNLQYGPEVFSPNQPQKMPGLSTDPSLGYSVGAVPQDLSSLGLGLSVNPGLGAPVFEDPRTGQVISGQAALDYQNALSGQQQIQRASGPAVSTGELPSQPPNQSIPDLPNVPTSSDPTIALGQFQGLLEQVFPSAPNPDTTSLPAPPPSYAPNTSPRPSASPVVPAFEPSPAPVPMAPVAAPVPAPVPSLPSSVPPATPGMTAAGLAAATDASAVGVSPDMRAPMGGGLLAAGYNMVNGWNPFGTGRLPPSDPFTMDDFIAQQNEMDRGSDMPSVMERFIAEDEPVADSAVDPSTMPEAKPAWWPDYLPWPPAPGSPMAPSQIAPPPTLPFQQYQTSYGGLQNAISGAGNPLMMGIGGMVRRP